MPATLSLLPSLEATSLLGSSKSETNGADSLDFEIRAFMKDVGYVLAIKSEMNYEITEAFNKEGIEIPFAQRDINIKNFDSLKNAFGSKSEKKRGD